VLSLPAIDRSGALVDVRLSETRDMEAAKAFFRSAKIVTGVIPARVITDGHDSYPRAIRTELDGGVKHRTNQYLNNRIEQDHRGVKAATDRCGASRVINRRLASAEVSTSSEVTSILIHVVAETFHLTPAAIVS
jgi:transposase-like protein